MACPWSSCAGNINGQTTINPTGNYTSSQNVIVTPANTERTVPATQSTPSQIATRSWDFGQWVLAEPLATSQMGTNGTAGTVGPSCGDVNDVAKCQKVGFVKVGSNDGKGIPWENSEFLLQTLHKFHE